MVPIRLPTVLKSAKGKKVLSTFKKLASLLILTIFTNSVGISVKNTAVCISVNSAIIGVATKGKPNPMEPCKIAATKSVPVMMIIKSYGTKNSY
jgi:hypothetical protein